MGYHFLEALWRVSDQSVNNSWRRILFSGLPFEGLLALEEPSASERCDVEKKVGRLLRSLNQQEDSGRHFSSSLEHMSSASQSEKLDIRESEATV